MPVKIGTRLRTLRMARVLTQEALAEKSGVSKATIIRLEAGKMAARFSTIHKLAHALGVAPEELAGGAPDTQLAA
jgi:transcriptional regulator with XRE-family HTH domain